MNKLLITSVLVLCLPALPLIVYAEPLNPEVLNKAGKQVFIKEAKTQIMSLAGALTATLKQGIKTQGHAASVKLCNLQAPAITKSSSVEGGLTDWTVSRTSLKTRNPANEPEGWVEQVLRNFEQRKENGMTAKDIAHTEILDGRFYLIKAIPTQEACLACHGSNISEEVKAQLTQLYPKDKAIGFNAGDIRGAFVASKEI